MSDLIYRQAAISIPVLPKEYREYQTINLDDAYELGWYDLQKCIEDLPSAQPEQECEKCIFRPFKQFQSEPRWIPCSERLPNIKEHHVSDPCIVYCENGAYGFTVLEENIFGQVGWNCERDDEYHEPLGEVVAWMPLPDPYEVEE